MSPFWGREGRLPDSTEAAADAELLKLLEDEDALVSCCHHSPPLNPPNPQSENYSLLKPISTNWVARWPCGAAQRVLALFV